MLQAVVDEVVGRSRDLRWGVCVRDAAGQVLAGHRADREQSAASVGKLLLLLEVARGLDAGRYDPLEPLPRSAVAPVADSGLWQHLAVEALPLADVAALVGAVSDNLATNVLLHRVGLGAVDALREHLGLQATRLHDVVRDARGPGDPPALSTGTADELARLLVDLHAGALAAGVRDRVLGWLAAGVDLSMVAAGWGLDPLAHAEPDRGLRLWHKTGTDAGVRADVGLLAGPARALGYAVLVSWDPGTDLRDAALAGLRDVGLALRRATE